MSIKLTRTPTNGSASKRVVQNKPSSSPASAAAKTEVATDATEVTGSERAGKREEAIANLVTANPTYYPTITPMPTTYMPTETPTTYYPTLSPTYMSGKSRKVSMDSKSGKGGKTSAEGGKSGKASPQIDYCEKAFEKAWEANIEAKKAIAETRQDLKDQCEFDTTDTNRSPFAPNLACPFIYTPDTGFLDEKDAVIEYFENITGSNETGIAFWEFQMYCACAKGMNEGCAAKIPDIPPIDETGLEYCKFAGIWNGNIGLDLLDTLDSEVQECGCTFVGTEKDDVSMCPGLGLGDNFDDPTDV